MKLSDLSIRRPVLASMVSLALVLFGAIGYSRLSVRDYPDIDPPVISVSTFLPGANPQVVESAVTDVLEEELSTVPGLRTLTSSSAEESSNILNPTRAKPKVFFNLGFCYFTAKHVCRNGRPNVRCQKPANIPFRFAAL